MDPSILSTHHPKKSHSSHSSHNRADPHTPPKTVCTHNPHPRPYSGIRRPVFSNTTKNTIHTPEPHPHPSSPSLPPYHPEYPSLASTKTFPRAPSTPPPPSLHHHTPRALSKPPYPQETICPTCPAAHRPILLHRYSVLILTHSEKSQKYFS
ncbi:hypothetical protein KMI_25g20160 [Encephalitozoon hellem]|nr:hypothetical protein KMI_25g20160 [Encephalitozoon hellem]